MLRWTEFLVLQERLADLRRESEEEMLVQEVLAARQKRDQVYHRLASWAGCVLVTWGLRLVQRYGLTVAVGHAAPREPQPTSRCVVASCRE